MKFTIMSDMHLEFSHGDFVGVRKGTDVLLLAGDIGLASDPYTFLPFLERVSPLCKQVLMIMGNHEHYHGDINKSEDLIRQATENIDNFTLLENEVAVIDDVAILGTTMWSAIDPLYSLYIAKNMNDYHIVKNNSIKVTTELHEKALAFLRESLVVKKSGMKVIVMSHHCPTMKAPEEYRGGHLNSAYGTDLTGMIEEFKPDLWVHGHTHVSHDYMVGDTNVVCNPRGYAGHDTNAEFNSELIKEV